MEEYLECLEVIICREMIVPEHFTGQLNPWALADGTMRIILVAGQLITKSFFRE